MKIIDYRKPENELDGDNIGTDIEDVCSECINQKDCVEPLINNCIVYGDTGIFFHKYKPEDK